MKHSTLYRGLSLLVAGIGLCFAVPSFAAEQTPGPTDWSEWEAYRQSVVHTATIIKPQDLQRARENIRRYPWARSHAERIQRSADGILETLSRAYLEEMIESTTPGCRGPCPACRAQGRPWHPNGQWSWSASRPNQLTCAVCKTVFPHEDFPETVVVKSSWGKGQEFTFIGGETFKCFGYTHARPSLSGIIRAKKVAHVTDQLETLSTAHALTDDPRYARGAKAILLRLAEVFPEYLVRAGYGYGEYAGMDPHVAARHIKDLPEDELVYPPNKPNRQIYAGYWAASRIGTSGMDGGWVVRVAVAYDLTCSAVDGKKPVYSRDERRRIEHDLLLESTYLAACDPAINNKSVGNRAGAAIVGMCVGHPGLVRFGLEGFEKTVEDWFLPDGGTSESPAYAMMTMNGIRSFALAFRDYSDPPGYRATNGTRLDGFDACRDTRYGDCWQGLIWTLQGDLRFPPSADSYRTTRIAARYAELLAVAYPSEEHLALLKEIVGEDLATSGSEEALFYREPGIEKRDSEPLVLPDVVFPFLAQGYLRTGEHGRTSLVMLNASDDGNHHHLDSLNLYYWQDGHELLSDLGYLWDHPDKYQTYRTMAHNLVVLDGQDQQRKNRGGSFQFFTVAQHVKAMEAFSEAYGPQAAYRRTCVLMDHGDRGSYLVDVFRVRGGTTRDYVFHGPGNSYEVDGLKLVPGDAECLPGGEFPLQNLRHAIAPSSWKAVWRLADGYEFRVFTPVQPGETVFLGDGWGQRDHRNTDRGATLPYVVRRQTGHGQDSLFVSVFAGNSARRQLVHDAELLSVDGGDADAVAVAIETIEGTDLVVSQLGHNVLRVPFQKSGVKANGRLAAIVSRGPRPPAACLVEGSRLEADSTTWTCADSCFQGDVLGVGGRRGRSYFVLDGHLPADFDPVGQTLFAVAADCRRAYPIRAVERTEGQLRVYTKRSGRGFEARPARHWELPVALEVEFPDTR